MWGIHRRPVNSPHKGPVTRKMFPFDDVIMLPSRFMAFVSAEGSYYKIRFGLRDEQQHWNGNFVILNNTSSLVLSELVILTTSGAVSAKNFVNMTLYFQCRNYCPACRTTFIATRFRVAVICPIIPVPHCIRVFFYFVWFVFINHIFQFYYELCTYCNILDIYLS